ncbi:MAG: hypothetical protein ACLPN1_01370 [Dissulfurispiraceae bacterium]
MDNVARLRRFSVKEFITNRNIYNCMEKSGPCQWAFLSGVCGHPWCVQKVGAIHDQEVN